MIAHDDLTAWIEIWGKGFRVSADSEEFQRLVPRERESAAPDLEKHLDSTSVWAMVLEPLYALSQKEIATQQSLLVRADHAMVLACSRTEDRHRRPSVVLVGCRIAVDWGRPDLAQKVSKAGSLAARLASEYSDTFRRNPERVQGQLREGRFTKDRRYDLAAESTLEANTWPEIIGAVKEWKGINGVATPRLAPLGANIIIGTKHEALAMQGRADIDGYFDVRERKIIALSPRLTPWPRPIAPVISAAKSAQERVPQQPVTNAPELQSIDQSLKRIDHSVERMADAVAELCRALIRIWLPDDRRPRK